MAEGRDRWQVVLNAVSIKHEGFFDCLSTRLLRKDSALCSYFRTMILFFYLCRVGFNPCFTDRYTTGYLQKLVQIEPMYHIALKRSNKWFSQYVMSELLEFDYIYVVLVACGRYC